ncbi:MAG: T9SS type A sorting domain-containing protein [Chitinophagaceae bacterium]|nr:T9SS type A sorting domain-containing protein [Chitinophagaceae bacterium]
MKLGSRQLSAKKSKSAVTALLILITATAYGKKSYKSNITAPPVFWNVFKAGVKKDKVLLTWVVTEYNNKVFYIQHSLNGSDWKTIDSVETKNSPLTLDEYTYTHTNKLEGRQYYRLRQVDIDLKKDGYSEVITLVLRQSKENVVRPAISLSPNPASDQIKVVSEISSESYYTRALVYDLSGKMIAEKKTGGHTNTFSVKDIPAGIYVIRVENNDGTSFTQKMIKQ